MAWLGADAMLARAVLAHVRLIRGHVYQGSSIAREIVEDLAAVLAEFEAVAEAMEGDCPLNGRRGPDTRVLEIDGKGQ